MREVRVQPERTQGLHASVHNVLPALCLTDAAASSLCVWRRARSTSGGALRSGRRNSDGSQVVVERL